MESEAAGIATALVGLLSTGRDEEKAAAAGVLWSLYMVQDCLSVQFWEKYLSSASPILEKVFIYGP